MSVRMLSRPSSSDSGSIQPVQQPAGGSSVIADSSSPVPTSPPLLAKPSAIRVSPSRSPGVGPAPSPSGRCNPSSSLLDGGSGPADVSEHLFSAVLGENPRASRQRFALPPPYECEDVPDPLSKQIVVIGVISRLEDEASQLLDRILLAQVFSGRKCASSRGRKNGQEDEGKVKAQNPNNSVSAGDNAAPSSNTKSEKLIAAQDTGTDYGRNHSKGKEKSDESSRNRDGFQRDHNSGSKAGDSNSDYAKKTAQGSESKKTESFPGRERDWIDGKMKNYYDKEKGVLYVQYVWGSLPRDLLMEDRRTGEGLAEVLEQHDGDGLRGLLFMFSVCHVLLIVQEGSRFDPRYLRLFRTLQSAKHALAPFVKTQVLPVVLPQPTNRPSQSLRSGSTRDSAGRSGVGVSTGRQSSSMGLISGSGPVLYPGQCTPVTLFVCLEECTESASGCSASGSTAEDVVESSGVSSSLHMSPASSSSPGSTHSRKSKSSHSTPGSSRPGCKTETGFRRKLQASTETQIRFLLKKCRTLASVAGEGGSSGSVTSPGIGLRGLAGGVNSFGGAGSGGVLFALDQSRAVVFVDRISNRPGAGLDEISDLLANHISNMGGPSAQTLNLTGLTEPMLDDVQTIKDFLLRHTEILRGRGAIASTTTGTSGGAGMVAAAAAAAAASASGGASGATKPLHNPPDLPTVTAWFSASQILADALTSAWETRDIIETEPATIEKNDTLKGQEISPRKGVRRYSQFSQGTHAISLGTSNLSMTARQRVSSLDGVISTMDGAVDIDNKFSMTWCKRSLPVALEVYLKDLPPTYPTLVHTAHLEKSLGVFHNMVRGPAVPSYVEKLRASCEAIWHAGRQLCDAVSLTGRPCRHLVHGVVDSVSDSLVKMCQTGAKTEKGLQRKDTKEELVFKEHASGVVFLHACACGRSRKLRKDPFDYERANVTFFQFPNCEEMLPSLSLPPNSSINLLGGPSWSLVRLGSARYYHPISGLMQVGFMSGQKQLSLCDIVVLYESNVAAVALPAKVDGTPEDHEAAIERGHSIHTPKILLPRPQHDAVEPKQGAQNDQHFYSKAAEKGPFNEINSMGTGTSTSTPRLDKVKVTTSSLSNINYGGDSAFPPLPQKVKKSTAPSKPSIPLGVTENPNGVYVELMQEETRNGEDNDTPGNTIMENTLASLKLDAAKEVKEDSHSVNCGRTSRIQHFQVYVGFEHECPHGHRFLLSANHVRNLGISYPQHGPVPGNSELDSVAGTDLRLPTMNEQLTTTTSSLEDTITEKKMQEGTEVMRIIKGSGDGHSLLGMDLPIFMNCPYCEASPIHEEKQEEGGYAGCVSQLQRIFLVTPPIPLMLATQAAVEYEASPSSSLRKQQVGKQGALEPSLYTKQRFKQVSTDVCSAPEVVLPPDSFLVLRLPFSYHTVQKIGNHKPLSYQKDAPERTAWLVKDTVLRVLAKGAGTAGAVS